MNNIRMSGILLSFDTPSTQKFRRNYNRFGNRTRDVSTQVGKWLQLKVAIEKNETLRAKVLQDVKNITAATPTVTAAITRVTDERKMLEIRQALYERKILEIRHAIYERKMLERQALCTRKMQESHKALYESTMLESRQAPSAHEIADLSLFGQPLNTCKWNV